MAKVDSKSARGNDTIANDIFALVDQLNAEEKEAQGLLSDDLADLPREFDEAFFEERRKTLLEYLSLSEDRLAVDLHPLVSVTSKGIFVMAENLQRLRDMFDPRAAAMGYRAAVAHAVPPPEPTVWLPLSCDAKANPRVADPSKQKATVVRLKFMKDIAAPTLEPSIDVRVDGVAEPSRVLNYRADFREINVVLDRDIIAEAFEVESSDAGDEISLQVLTSGSGQ